MSGPATASARGVTVALLVLCLLGVADAAYLTWDHYAHLASADFAGGLCGVGGGCDLARTSPLSEVPLPAPLTPLPIALLGLAFYAAFAVLALQARLSSGAASPEAVTRPTLGVMVVGASLSVAYSAFLAVASLRAGGLCPFCTGLYVVNLGLLLVTVGPARRRAGGLVLRFSALASRPVVSAAVTFALTLGAGYSAYAAALARAAPPAAAETPLLKGAAQSLPTEGRPSLGPPDAQLQVVEFADFECPHCGRAFAKLLELAEAFPHALRITFLHFPLDHACNPLVTRPFHERACTLARLAECAHAEGRYVAVATMLYAEAKTQSDAALEDAAVALGLDRARLRACLAGTPAQAAVQADLEAGIAAGVRGTPTLFLGGRELARPLSEALIRELLAAPEGAAP